MSYTKVISRLYALERLVKNLIGKVNSAASSYQAYVAIISQSGSSEPVVTVLNENASNYLGPILWTRNASGEYFGISAGAFPVAKTWLMAGQGAPTSAIAIVNITRASDNQVTLFYTNTATGAATDNFVDLAVEIRVYP
jgi:hypothetical protein